MALLGFSIVLLHLIVGFGFLIYKLSPRKKGVKTGESTAQNLNN